MARKTQILPPLLPHLKEHCPSGLETEPNSGALQMQRIAGKEKPLNGEGMMCSGR